MDTDTVGRSLLILGAVIALVGIGVLVVSRVPFIGRLPGDISFQRDGFALFFPIVTCIIMSILLTIAVNLGIRLLR